MIPVSVFVESLALSVLPFSLFYSLHPCTDSHKPRKIPDMKKRTSLSEVFNLSSVKLDKALNEFQSMLESDQSIEEFKFFIKAGKLHVEWGVESERGGPGDPLEGDLMWNGEDWETLDPDAEDGEDFS